MKKECTYPHCNCPKGTGTEHLITRGSCLCKFGGNLPHVEEFHKNVGDQPAFPTMSSLHGQPYNGLTKREYFAGQAMAALIPIYQLQPAGDSELTRHEHIAVIAMEYADGLLEVLEA